MFGPPKLQLQWQVGWGFCWATYSYKNSIIIISKVTYPPSISNAFLVCYNWKFLPKVALIKNTPRCWSRRWSWVVTVGEAPRSPCCIWLRRTLNNGKIWSFPRHTWCSSGREGPSSPAQGWGPPDTNLLGCSAAVVVVVMLDQSPPQRVALQEVPVPCGHRDGDSRSVARRGLADTVCVYNL